MYLEEHHDSCFFVTCKFINTIFLLQNFVCITLVFAGMTFECPTSHELPISKLPLSISSSLLIHQNIPLPITKFTLVLALIFFGSSFPLRNEEFGEFSSIILFPSLKKRSSSKSSHSGKGERIHSQLYREHLNSRVWQLGDPNKQAGSCKAAMTQEKDALTQCKARMEMSMDFV